VAVFFHQGRDFIHDGGELSAEPLGGRARDDCERGLLQSARKFAQLRRLDDEAPGPEPIRAAHDGLEFGGRIRQAQRRRGKLTGVVNHFVEQCAEGRTH